MRRQRAMGIVVLFVAAVMATPRAAAAQSGAGRFSIGGQLVGASFTDDGNDIGVGARVAWHPGALVAVESELNLFPGEFPEGRAFSKRRVEGLFGVTAGPRIGRVRVFGAFGAGFLRVEEAPGPVICILIFPPPLSCTLAAGATLTIVHLGGGVEAAVTPRTFVRVDAGDRLTRYPAPAIDFDGSRRDEPFFGHGFRFTAGAGWRF